MSSFSDLLVLNAEIAALVRAGIPLELGLRRLSQTLPGRLGTQAERLAVRLESGQSLVAALQAEELTVSPLYTAVIEAAVEADRLPEALDGLVKFGRMAQEARRQISLALMYPTIVAVMGYGLFILFMTVLLPERVAHGDPFSPLRAWAEPIVFMVRDTALWWIPGIPLAIWCGLQLASHWGRHRSDGDFVMAEAGPTSLNVGFWIPGVPELYQDMDRANSTHLMSLLLQHGVPLPRALALASRATGSHELSAAYERLSTAVSSGRSLSAEVPYERRLPPIIAQLLRAGALDRDLPEALERASEIFQRRVIRRAAWLRTTLAPAFAVIIGGGTTFLFVLIFVLPLKWIFDELLQRV